MTAVIAAITLAAAFGAFGIWRDRAVRGQGSAHGRSGRDIMDRLCLPLGTAGVLLISLLLVSRVADNGEPRDVPQSEVVVCVDVSKSMWARDVAPDRLGRARLLVRDLTLSRRADRLGLVLFAGEAQPTFPLTTDQAIVTGLLDDAGPYSLRTGGSRLDLPLALARTEMWGEPSGASRTIILITDGEDPQGLGAVAARECVEEGIVVHCVGLGGDAGARIPILQPDGTEAFLLDGEGGVVFSKPDQKALRELAQEGGGSFVEADSVSALRHLLSERTAPLTSPWFLRSSVETVLLLMALGCWLGALACGLGGRS